MAASKCKPKPKPTTAGKLVITAGSWTKLLLADLGLNLPLRIMPCQIAFFEADKPEDYEPGNLPIFLAHINGIYGEIPYGIPSVDGSGVKISTFYDWQTVTHPNQVDYTPKDMIGLSACAPLSAPMSQAQMVLCCRHASACIR